MKITIEKAILASTVLYLVFLILLAFQFIANTPQGSEIFSLQLLLPLALMWFIVLLPFAVIWLFGMLSIFGSWYDIFTSKNDVVWKIGWAAAVFFLNFIGIFAYLFIGRKDRK